MKKTKRIYNCPFCESKFYKKDSLYEHMEEEHDELLHGLPASQVYFNHKYNKKGGKCIICGKPTKWNEKTEKYERLCTDKICRDKYRKLFIERMRKVHGKDTLLNDPEQQKKMLEGRHISGVYEWENRHRHKYVGSYEYDLLEFLETFLSWENPNDIIMPSPLVVEYEYDGKKHFYLPDVMISSINLHIEVKGTNNHYQKRDKDKEKAKDKAIEKVLKKFKPKQVYLKIVDKDYQPLIDLLIRKKR